MRIAYLTTLAPCGEGETFVLREIAAAQKLGHTVVIVPTRPQTSPADDRFAVWFCRAQGAACYGRALRTLCRHPLRSLRACGALLMRSGSLLKAMKNLYFVPKALATADYLERDGRFDAIHAHWLATTASVAYIAARITGLPWGATGHRFDIYENNALAEKARHAVFLRTIDHKGARHVAACVPPEQRGKVHCIYLGVDFPSDEPEEGLPQGRLTVCVPAHLIPVKGHRYLIEAMALLRERGEERIRCVCYGEGALHDALREQSQRAGVEDRIAFPGALPHEELIDLYRRHAVDVVLLSSVVLGPGEHEGLPAALMEAMAYRLPAVATDTGGIAELLGEGCGVLVPEKNPAAVADALQRLLDDPAYYAATAQCGYQRVRERFDNRTNTRAVLALFDQEREETHAG